jgi:7-cyano-7-deazaguanine synthase
MRTVLFSGGLDSTAALHWAQARGPARAVGFDYGQPHRNAELTTAGVIAARRGVPFDVLVLPEIGRLNPSAGRDSRGLSLAFLPGRNALFLARAAMAYATPGEDLTLVFGANRDDAAGFPDCRPEFFNAAEVMLRAALRGLCEVKIETPWVYMTKASVLKWCTTRPDALADARESVSCYRGTRCGKCDACRLRRAAFVKGRIADGTAGAPKMHGGDPGRDARLK